MEMRIEITTLKPATDSARYSLFSPEIGKIRYSIENGVVKNGEWYVRPEFVPIKRFTPEQAQYLTRTMRDTINIPDELIGRVILAYYGEVEPAQLIESKVTERVVQGLEQISQWKPRKTGSQIQMAGELAVGTTGLLVGLNLLAQHDASVTDYHRQTRRFYDTVVEIHKQVKTQLDRRLEELIAR